MQYRVHYGESFSNVLTVRRALCAEDGTHHPCEKKPGRAQQYCTTTPKIVNTHKRETYRQVCTFQTAHVPIHEASQAQNTQYVYQTISSGIPDYFRRSTLYHAIRSGSSCSPSQDEHMLCKAPVERSAKMPPVVPSRTLARV